MFGQREKKIFTILYYKLQSYTYIKYLLYNVNYKS